MPELPQISVLMPVYNVERFVASAIDSILSQTFGDFELIITDDGSKDATPAIVQTYAARDSRVRLSQQPNAGITITLNRQIALARGPFLARMDGDDISLPTRFEKQLRFLQEHADHVLVGCQCLLIDPD
ncbi:MAG TPA: glycosyltransferase family A protein, partial [Tepidisphaeraceae bacterium]|nr:glycosyltransferase family A protein [Tepidisphaeraceae bacterium]